MAEQFARDAFKSVSLHRMSSDLAGNSQTQARFDGAVCTTKHGEVTVCAALRCGEHRAEIVLFDKARVAREAAIAYGQSRARPLARRAFNTLRPFLVAMRARNPWVRLRFLTLG